MNASLRSMQMHLPRQDEQLCGQIDPGPFLEDMTTMMTEERRTPEAPGLVVGIVDRNWVVQQISIHGSAHLGAPSADLLGLSILEQVHHGDHEVLLSAGNRAITEGASVASELHMGRSGRWTRVRMMVTPMVDGDHQLAFLITGADRVDHSNRTTRLEQHLRRIADELEAAGIDIRVDAGIDPDRLPGADQLSPRQWEVLRRLLRGERVPGIANALFLSTSTVRNHLTAIFAKVGVHSQAELIALLRTPAAAEAGPR